ncbi:MAG: hypothetical protein HY331_16780 [Chloroflexi bacterium]|nr:hypothetical protein [Chloroflexota bacterium]
MSFRSRRGFVPGPQVWIPLAKIGIIAGSLYLSFWIVSRYVQGTLQFGLEIAPFVLGPVVLFFAFRWRLGILPVLLLLSIEGLLVVLNDNPQIYLVKDVFLAAMFFGMLAESLFRRNRLLFRSPLNPVLVGLLVLGLIQAVNPAGGGPLVAALGLRSLFIYITAAYLVHAICETREQLVRVALFITLVALPVELYGVYQFSLGPRVYEQQLGLKPIEFEVGPDGSLRYFRPSSTFAAPGQYGGFQLFTVLMTLGVVNLPSLGLGPKYLAWTALIASVLGTAIGGQRSNWVLLMVSVPMLGVLRGVSFRSIPQVALPVLGGLAFAFTLGGPFLEARFESLTVSGQIGGRQTPVLQSMLPGLTLALETATSVAPFGRGIGLTLASARHLTTSSEPLLWAESFLVGVTFQLGALGLVLMVLVFVVAIWRAFTVARSRVDDDLAWLAAVLGCYFLAVFVLSFSYAPLYTFPTAVYFWIGVGMVERIHTLIGKPSR